MSGKKGQIVDVQFRQYSKACVIAQESDTNLHECRESNWCGCDCHGSLIEDYVAEQQAEEQYRSMIENPEYWEARTGHTDLW
jgi:hypothetical protein